MSGYRFGGMSFGSFGGGGGGETPVGPVMGLIFTQPGNRVKFSDVTDVPAWWSFSESFWMGAGPTSVLMQVNGVAQEWAPIQGEITDTFGVREVANLGNSILCHYSNAVPATYP